MATTLDRECLGAIRSAPRSALSWYLMASCLYYHADHSLLSDSLYDRLARDLLEEWDTLEHRHKYLLSKDDLAAGTLFKIKLEEYPWIVRCAATRLVGSALPRQVVATLIADYGTKKPAPRVRERTPVQSTPVARTRIRERPPAPVEPTTFMPNTPRIRTRTRGTN